MKIYGTFNENDGWVLDVFPPESKQYVTFDADPVDIEVQPTEGLEKIEPQKGDIVVVNNWSTSNMQVK